MLLKLLSVYLPVFIKKQKIRELFHGTADAFQCEVPNLNGLSCQALLLKYALFTQAQAERSIQCGYDLEPIKSKLHKQGFRLGKGLRNSLNITTLEEYLQTSRIIYSILGVDFHCDSQGNIMIRQCFFSQFYSPEVCRIISALDEGLASGLVNGDLRFYQRITEGHNCCKAHLKVGKVLL